MRRRLARVVSAMALGVATVVVPVVAATPAHADYQACTKYVRDKGYEVGYPVLFGCSAAANGDQNKCAEHLGSVINNSDVVKEACRRGAQ